MTELQLEKLMGTNLDEFTSYVAANPHCLSERLIFSFIENHMTTVKSTFEYYYVLRTLPTILKDHTNYVLIGKEFKDELFIQKAYQANRSIDMFLSELEFNMYIEKVFPYNVLADIYRGWKTFVTALKIGA